MNVWHQADLSEAIRLARQPGKLLLVLITDTSDGTKQFEALFQDDVVRRTLGDTFVCLKLVSTTEEARLFGQIYTISTTPILYIIKGGLPVHRQSELCSVEELVKQLNYVKQTRTSPQPHIGNAAGTSPNAIPPIPSGINTREGHSQRPRTNSGSASASCSPSNPSDNHGTRTAISPVGSDGLPDLTSAKTTTIRATSHHNSSPASSQANIPSTSGLTHRRNTTPARAKYGPQRSLAPSPPVTEPKQPMGIDSPVTHLVIRLLDGSTLRAEFASSQTLHDLRHYIANHRTDSTAPYHLLQLYPRQQFTPAQDNQTLRELGLVPSSTLVLKPLAPEETTPVQRITQQTTHQVNEGMAHIWAFILWMWQCIFRFWRCLTGLMRGNHRQHHAADPAQAADPTGRDSVVHTHPTRLERLNQSQSHSHTPEVPSGRAVHPAVSGSVHASKIRKRSGIVTIHSLQDSTSDDDVSYNGNSTNMQ
ncbi:hypothetical protein IWQ62_000168 [Dispira parvispora]|uniref:UBX domain-containing protein 2 n=1 Tax=Dispira parvispora TaxID=1520584 RepID=A0A9W8AVE6_9FUNG|nr:hypothetical protein IWQ62_000168 [Dispira parvispora]